MPDKYRTTYTESTVCNLTDTNHQNYFEIGAQFSLTSTDLWLILQSSQITDSGTQSLTQLMAHSYTKHLKQSCTEQETESN